MNATVYKITKGYKLSLTNDIDDLYAISDEELSNHNDLKLLSVESCENLFTEDVNEVKVYIEMEIIGTTKVLNPIKGVKGSVHKITTYDKYPKLDHMGCLIIKPLSLHL
jgi:hypothetical protein